MVNVCHPSVRFNYKARPKAATFGFPKDVMKKKWIAAIHWKDYVTTQ